MRAETRLDAIADAGPKRVQHLPREHDLVASLGLSSLGHDGADPPLDVVHGRDMHQPAVEQDVRLASLRRVAD